MDNRTRERHLQPDIRSAVAFASNVYPVDCDDESGDIRTALQRLSSGEYTAIEQGRYTLLGRAKKSPPCRKEVVRALMESMDKPDLNFEREISSYFVWREGSQLLGELKATESLDLLISHLDLTNGLHSSSKVFQPAILGVRQMGPAAIPKLAVALLQSPKAGVRMAAAYCLTDIGGVSAMNALRHAQDGEANKCVSRFISISLSTFSYKSNGRSSFDNEAPQANIDARRNWLTAFECVE
ncbi:MAG: HEAT repeat domain-containing protein [Pyrinomonadaceae bacterium]